MPDTASPFLKLRLPATGAYNNSWGSVLNSDALTLLDHAITGRVTIDLAGLSTLSLPAIAIGAASNSRYFCLSFTGIPSGAPTVTVPASVTKKLYLIDNQCGQTITLKYASGTGVAIETGVRFLVWCDGAEVYPVAAQATDADSLGGVDAAQYARLDILNEFDGPQALIPVEVTDGAVLTLDAALGNVFVTTISANRSVANPTNPHDGQPLWFVIKQDATGGRTLTWSSKWIFPSSIAPTLSSAANAVDAVQALYIEALDMWLVLAVQSALNTSGSGGAGNSYTISENTSDWRLIDRVGTGAGAINITITIAAGVCVQSLSNRTPALDLSGLDAGSTVNLVNAGFILGHGGNGGNGAMFRDVTDSSEVVNFATVGQAGGDAIKGPGSGITFNVTNTSGRIWGGGGGGGGGGVSNNRNSSSSNSYGGGGGGGAGGGAAGYATPGGNNDGSSNAGGAATNGSTGSAGTAGTAGGGGQAGSAVGGSGGNGGDWGGAGTTGDSPTTYNYDTAGAAGGAAGKAINLNSGAMGTFSGSGSPNVKGAVA